MEPESLLNLTNNVLDLIKSVMPLDSIIYSEIQSDCVFIINDKNESYRINIELIKED